MSFLLKARIFQENMAETGPSLAQQELPHLPQFEYTEEERESILADKDINVRDPILPIFELHRVTKSLLNCGAEGVDHLSICKSRLINAVVPQVHNFPGVVQWCA